MSNLVALLFGLVFGAGLIVAGMTDPGRVIGFLDVGGAWNPSLAAVMAAAVGVAAPAFAWMRRRRRSLLGEAVTLPDRRTVTPHLLVGAVLFGLGWGLSGICPGPAVVLLGQGGGGAVLFVAAMIAGQWIGRLATGGRRAVPDRLSWSPPVAEESPGR